MKKIGEGYYYKVFAHGDGRVIKVVKTRIEIFIHLLIVTAFNPVNALREYKATTSAIPKIKEIYEKVVATLPSLSILGSPVFINELDYLQDRASDLRDINDFTQDEFKRTMRDYVGLVKKLWRYGISDSVFNFSINCGYNQKGDLILFDFNEIDFDKGKVLANIKNEIWLERASFLHLTKEKQNISRTILREGLTEDALERNWKRG